MPLVKEGLSLTLQPIEKAATELADERAGWVTRRDAADALGRAAEKAIRALQARRHEKDIDVKTAVDRALGRVSAALAGEPAKGGYTLEELAQACAKPGKRIVTAEDEGYTVEVMLSNDRRQRVRVEETERERGRLVVISTRCGKATPDALSWALRANVSLTLGALALVEEDGEERFLIRNCYIAREATPLEVKASVKEVAFYGDWIERKLAGSEDLL